MMKSLLRLRFCWRPLLCLAILWTAVAAAKAAPPVLLNRANSTRAVALEALSLQREPFAVDSSSLLSSSDKRTRIMLFALNLSGATVSNVTVDAEDGAHRHYKFDVEFVGPLKGGEDAGITQLTVRFSDDLTVVGDVLVRLTYGGVQSNRVRVGIGYVGDGLPDDFIKISGRIGTDVTGLAGVLVMLTGTLNQPTVTDASGVYSFTNIVPGGSYTVTASRINYTLSPQVHNLPYAVADQIANFSATPVDLMISGQVTDNGNPLAGVAVALSGSQSAIAMTDSNGKYSLNAAAEGNYLVSATSPLYGFGPSSAFFNNLSSNQTVNFAATSRPTFTISGYVKKPDGSAVPGTTVSLTGLQNSTVSTDAAGFFAFSNLASGDYSVSAFKPGYSVSPATQSFPKISANQQIIFTTTLVNYTISGRVADPNGAGVPNVVVLLSGSQSASVSTDTDGRYSFTVQALGNYGVTPTSAINSFTPSMQTFDTLGGDRTVNFAAVDLIGYYTLDFNGDPKTVDYGDFFQLQPGQTELGKFFWEFWAKPGSNAYARYMLSDGYGGAHALLCGFVGDSNGQRYALYGNVWNGVTAIDYGADDGPAPFEWAHVAVGWDGEYIYTYFDGVPVGLKPFAGPRLPAGSNNGGGRLFIGGSDHSNFDGRIEQVRGFENVNPRDKGLQTITFRPDTLFGITPGTSPGPSSTFLTNFFRPMLTVPDFAGGRLGVLRSGWPVTSPVSTYPLAQFVVDSEAPNSSPTTGPKVPNGKIDAPGAVPNAALIFDSFSRRSSTYAFNGHGGLGNTEGGTAGIKQWKTSGTGGTADTPPAVDEAFGILNGKAVVLLDSSYGGIAWVETNSTTGYLYAMSSRSPGFYKSGLDTGLAFRVADASNYFFAFTYGDRVSANARKLIVGYWLNSKLTYLQVGTDMPPSWTRLQVVTTAAGSIDIYADTTLIYSTNSNVLANATGVGLFNFSGEYALANRWDNFTVYDHP